MAGAGSGLLPSVASRGSRSSKAERPVAGFLGVGVSVAVVVGWPVAGGGCGAVEEETAGSFGSDEGGSVDFVSEASSFGGSSGAEKSGSSSTSMTPCRLSGSSSTVISSMGTTLQSEVAP